MNSSFYQYLEHTLSTIRHDGLFKNEHVIASPQHATITLNDGRKLINFCANNYLGLADHPVIVETARNALTQYGYGMSSVRFICGTQTPHVALEQAISEFMGMDDAILYSSCFDANGGLFETLLGADDAVISDELNHASIIDGIRLCKAARYRYRNNDLQDLENQLIAADSAGARFRLIATDGVFSMDGIIANLKGICDLADRYQAIVMVDDSHATGFLGKQGRGSLEHCGVLDRVDVMTGTLGKGLGGALGGFTTGKKPIIDLLRQRSRPYLFSNALMPAICTASVAALRLVQDSHSLREQLQRNQKQFRHGLEAAGFELIPGEHPIIPVMLYDEKIATEMAEKLLTRGIYVVQFSYPVVPKGKARIRTQMSAIHTEDQIAEAIDAFISVGQEMEILQ